MSHRLGALSSDYCSVCQNGLLPSAAATASNPLWPLAAPFLMTNCQPAPTKARLKCQHRMTKGPRGSSETNCVQYELILYSRAGACLAAGCSGCWLASERTPRAGPGHRTPVACRPAWGPWARRAAWGGSLAAGGVSWEIRGTSRGLSSVGAGWARRVVASPGNVVWRRPCWEWPRGMGSVPDIGGTGLGTVRAARKMPKPQEITPHKETVVQSIQSAPLGPMSRALAFVHTAGPREGVSSRTSFHPNRCLTTSCNPPPPVFANLLGGGRQAHSVSLASFSPESLLCFGGVLSSWDSLGVLL